MNRLFRNAFAGMMVMILASAAYQFAGPVDRAVSAASLRSQVDSTPPIGTIVINNGDLYTKSAAVTLTLTASDPVNGIRGMQLRNSDGDWQPEEPFAATKAWTLTAGDGVKEVEIRLYDQAGNPAIYSDQIIQDTVGPAAEIMLPHVIHSNSFGINWSGTDQTSGVKGYDLEYKEGSGAWDRLITGTPGTQVTVAGALPAHAYFFRIRATDAAGNVSDWAEDRVIYSTSTVYTPVIVR